MQEQPDHYMEMFFVKDKELAIKEVRGQRERETWIAALGLALIVGVATGILVGHYGHFWR